MNDSKSEQSFPRALNPPEGAVIIVDKSIMNSAIETSRRSPRGRVILPFHRTGSDSMHRMLNALQPFSYIQPHRHHSPPKAESIIVLKGSIGYVTFQEDGTIDCYYTLSAHADRIGVDTKPGVYHTFFALESDTLLFEVKPGPYDERSDKDFASWAPGEGTEGVTKYLENLFALVMGKEIEG
ncbi:cupin fold metalloprotein, WbuC family [bacterium]|nr:MAG: cupin fold metalloprotein, WbuC family [bacterium]